MADKHRLYQEVILEHNRNPRNYGELPGATVSAEGHNRLCGDHLSVFLKVEDGRITGSAFAGTGCAIAKASASIMTTMLNGKTEKEVRAVFEIFRDMVTGNQDRPVDEEALGPLAAFSGLRAYPVRVPCATLPWETALAALAGRHEAATE